MLDTHSPMASVLSWFSSALGSAAQSWLGARPVASPRPSPSKVDLSYFSSSRFELDAQTAFMPPEPPLTRLDGEHESWELLLDAASQNFTCPGDEEHVPESQVKFGESWRRSVREVSENIELGMPVAYTETSAIPATHSLNSAL